MNKAFVKESDGDTPEELPDRSISAHRNLVTAQGMAQIEEAVARLQREHLAAGDAVARARIGRDLRYWTARRATAELVGPPPDAEEVRFGSTVTIARPDGRRQTWRIVGEDEADPARGTLSYVSPVARALLGSRVGDIVQAGPMAAEVLEIA